MVIVSDDAGQFDVLLHALYWIHACRAIDKIIAFSDQAQNNLDTVKDQIRMIPSSYRSLHRTGYLIRLRIIRPCRSTQTFLTGGSRQLIRLKPIFK